MFYKLNRIGIADFRVFEGLKYFDLKRLTLLTGPNNSGKSSLTKFLLLLQDNIRRNGLNELDFRSNLHSLSSFEYAVNHNSRHKNNISFTIHVVNKMNLIYNIELVFAPLMKLTFNFYGEKERGKLSNIMYGRNEDKKFHTIFIIQLPRKGADQICMVHINLDYLKRKFVEEVNRIKQIPDSVLTLPTDTGDTQKAVKIQFSGCCSNWVPIKDEVVSFSNGLIVDRAKIEMIFSFDNEEDLDRFCMFLESVITNHSSVGIFNEDEWYNHDVNSREVMEMGYGKFGHFGYNELIDRYIERYLLYVTNIKVKDLLIDEELNLRNYDKNDITNSYNIEYERNCYSEFKELIDYMVDCPVRYLLTDAYLAFIEFISEELKDVIKKALESFDVCFLPSYRASLNRLFPNDNSLTSFNELLVEYSRSEIDPLAIEFANKWINLFEIGEEIIVDRISGEATTIKVRRGCNIIDIVDLGYGVSQLLPIILKLVLQYEIEPKYDLPSDQTDFCRKMLIIEEPEAHLHPKLQSKLGDFFVDVLKRFQVSLIIETHSEYLIRKIQYLTATNVIASNNIGLYYFQENWKCQSASEVVRRIEFGKDGSLDEGFGKGFFDESLNLRYELAKYKNKN